MMLAGLNLTSIIKELGWFSQRYLVRKVDEGTNMRHILTIPCSILRSMNFH